jgi:hypothetical protein
MGARQRANERDLSVEAPTRRMMYNAIVDFFSLFCDRL